MQRMFRLLAAVLVGVASQSTTADTVQDLYPAGPYQDTRRAKLQTFFKTYQCPEPYYVDEYLREADAHGIDFRLLPALSVRETTCGEYDHLNNHWGWDSGRISFGTVPSGIHFVTARLAESPYYKGKALEEKLRVYNPNARYVEEIKQLMREIEQ